MIQHSIKILIALFLFCGNCYSQASWDFSIWFNLSDKQGRTIPAEKFRTLKVYSQYGTQVHSVIQYDTIAEMYKFTAQSALPNSILVFIYKDEITTVICNADEPYSSIDSIALDGNSYDFYYDRSNSDKVRCGEHLNGYKNKQVCKTVKPLSSFRVEKILKPNEMNFENHWNWTEVKLEL
jgi:hypothetical protein